MRKEQQAPPSATFEEEAARRTLARLPGFSEEVAARARFSRLVGFTNHVYKVELGEGAFCLRIPGQGAAALVDRRAEEINARAAAQAGVAPEVIHFGSDGVMLTRFVDEALPLSPSRVAESEGALQRAAYALRTLHDARIEFANSFDAFAFIGSYLEILDRLGVPLTGAQRRAVAEVRSLGETLRTGQPGARPCHCDPTGRNLLDTGDKVWLVDWEYSGMNDPMWDLAYFSIESRLDDAGDAALTRAYFGGEPALPDAARVAVLKPVAEVLAALWALIQVGENIHSGDFLGYAERSLAGAAARMDRPEFRKHVAALAG